MIPKILKNFNLFVDGRGYVGLIEDITLPKLSATMTELQSGGMDVPLDVEMGMDKLECSFNLFEYDVNVIKQFGLGNGAQVPLTLKGAMDDEEKVIPIVITIKGAWKELDFGNWKAGDNPKLGVTVSLRYYKLEIDGKPMVEIDVANMIRKIDGKDQLESTRSAIGI